LPSLDLRLLGVKVLRMRWTPLILLIVAIAIAVIVARGLPENLSNVSDNGGVKTPVDDAARAARPSTPTSE
jgi:hypothetical protein